MENKNFFIGANMNSEDYNFSNIDSIGKLDPVLDECFQDSISAESLQAKNSMNDMFLQSNNLLQKMQDFYDKETAELNKLLREKDRRIRELEKKLLQLEGNSDDYIYKYDITNYGGNPSHLTVKIFWDGMRSLTNEITQSGEFLIKSQSDVAPVFIILTKSNKFRNSTWHWCGTLKDFCDSWNVNVIPRIDDNERAQKLICNPNTLSKVLNRTPWKNTEISKWKDAASEQPRYKKDFECALNIKDRFERLVG